MSPWIKYIGLWAGGSYLADVLIRPKIVASEARSYAASRNKPVINVGAGTPKSSLRAWIFGPTTWGDVNIDIEADPHIPPGPNQISWGDAHHLPYRDKTFGSLIASHVLEHMDDPVRAMREWVRVADQVYVVVPRWWAAHTWLHPGHLWYITPDMIAYPLWKNKNDTVMLLPSR